MVIIEIIVYHRDHSIHHRVDSIHHCDHIIHRDSMGDTTSTGMALLHNGFTRFSYYLQKILFAVHLKHSSFEPSADFKPMSNDLVHAMPLQYMQCPCSACFLSMCMLRFVWLSFMPGLK